MRQCVRNGRGHGGHNGGNGAVGDVGGSDLVEEYGQAVGADKVVI